MINELHASTLFDLVEVLSVCMGSLVFSETISLRTLCTVDTRFLFTASQICSVSVKVVSIFTRDGSRILIDIQTKVK